MRSYPEPASLDTDVAAMLEWLRRLRRESSKTPADVDDVAETLAAVERGAFE